MKAINLKEYKNNIPQETKIIKRILDGEKELYEILVRRNNQKLYRVIRSYLKEEFEIEDVMQDTYIKAYTKLHQFKFESSFSTWLVRIGINESMALLNERSKRYRTENHCYNPQNDFLSDIPDKSQINADDLMIQRETKKLLEHAIDKLELKYKTVYIMKEVEEMSLKEIAEILDLTLSNVKVRLYRAKQALKEILYESVNAKNIFEFGFSKCDRITETVMKKIY